MKNKEFYKDKIFDAICKYKNLAVDKYTGEPASCHQIRCSRCYLNERSHLCEDEWKLWLEQEHVESLLTPEEKRYLENVIRPFKDRVRFIQKDCVARRYTFIRADVDLYDDCDYADSFSLPYFDGTKMYTGMEIRKSYTLEELGLFTDKEEDSEE